MARTQQARVNRPEPAWPQWRRPFALLLGVAALVLGLGAVVLWLAEPANLPVRTVRVEGELQHVAAEALREAVLPHAEAGFLRVDIDRVRAAVEQLPWVHSAQVRRAWPDTLLVQLREQQVLARWGDGGLVNPEGRVFRPEPPVGVEKLPLLRGPEGTAPMLTSQFITLRQVLAPLQLTIVEVTMDERRAWRLTLDNGMEMMLGRNEHSARVERFVRAWPRILGPRSATVARVDLRYTNGFAVQWRQAAHTGA